MPPPLLLLVLLLAAGCVAPGAAVEVCQLTANPAGSLIDVTFNEAYGTAEPLPANGQQHPLVEINGTAVATKAEVTSSTFLLTLRNPSPLPRFKNGSEMNPASLFSLSVVDGTAVLVLRQGLDRESLWSEFFEVEAPCESSDRSNTLRLLVKIIDVNDNTPLFYATSAATAPSTEFSATVAENTPEAVMVYAPGAVIKDADATLDNSKAEWSMLPNPYFQQVEITEIRIYTSACINYEALNASKQISIVLVAKDSPRNASMALSSSATFVFTVTDVDDLPPKFLRAGCVEYRGACVGPRYSADVVSGVNASSPLTVRPGPIVAVDQDTLNFSVRYSIVEGAYSSNFSIDPLTAEVTQLAPLDRHTVSSVQLVIMATEFSTRTDVEVNNLYDAAVLNIAVVSSDSRPPVLSLNLAAGESRVTENSPVGTRVTNANGTQLRIVVTDPDLLPSDAARKYKFEVTNTALFVANEDGTLSVNSDLIDYEALGSNKAIDVSVTVTESDSSIANRSSSLTVSVSVLDENDNSPVWRAASYEFSVKETSASGGRVSVGSVAADDRDSGQRGTAGLRYSIAAGDATVFAVDETSGQLTAVGPLLRGDSFVLTLRVSDSDPRPELRRSAEVTVVVTVTRQLDL